MRWKLSALLAVLIVSGLFMMAGVVTVANGQDGQRSASLIMQDWNTAIVVPLSGAAEREAPVNTNASGVAVFWMDMDNQSMCYLIFVANVDNATMAHIHMIQGTNTTGQPVVWLYPVNSTTPTVKSGETNGLLAVGSFNASNFVGPMANMTMDDLLNGIDNGSMYVNVHNTDHPEGLISGDINVKNMTCSSMMAIWGNMTQSGQPGTSNGTSIPGY